jgi:hypothetical protein
MLIWHTPRTRILQFHPHCVLVGMYTWGSQLPLAGFWGHQTKNTFELVRKWVAPQRGGDPFIVLARASFSYKRYSASQSAVAGWEARDTE